MEAARGAEGRDFLIMCSYVELYNEELRDLLHLGEKGRL